MKIELKFGNASSKLSFHAAPINVFVGPNNSGKSVALRELELMLREVQTHFHVIDNIEFQAYSPEAAQQLIDFYTLSSDGDTIAFGRPGRWQSSFQRQFLMNLLTNEAELNSKYRSHIAKYMVMHVGGDNRLMMCSQQDAGSLRVPPASPFQSLFRDQSLRAKLRSATKNALNRYAVIDPTNPIGKLGINLTDEEPLGDIEQRIDENAMEYQKRATPIAQFSDGVRAFIGIITTVLASDYQYLFLDEPEAFLHPSLSQTLGSEMSHLAKSSGKTVFAATHSPFFVMGCVQSGVPLNIIRLTYDKGVPTARILSSGQLLHLMRNPLLRSANLLSAIFYDSVIVTESDYDRAFYQEVNYRLAREIPDWSAPNCLFINAQNKQTVPTIVEPLRQLGIPAAGIVDIDVLKEGGAVFKKFLNGMNLPQHTHTGLSDTRARVVQTLTNADSLNQVGLSAFNTEERRSAEHIIRQLAEHGLFVVPGGELESWLQHLAVQVNKSKWLTEMFSRMGEDPQDGNYVHPDRSDVWEFIGSAAAWLKNPSRFGMPV